MKKLLILAMVLGLIGIVSIAQAGLLEEIIKQGIKQGAEQMRDQMINDALHGGQQGQQPNNPPPSENPPPSDNPLPPSDSCPSVSNLIDDESCPSDSWSQVKQLALSGQSNNGVWSRSWSTGRFSPQIIIKRDLIPSVMNGWSCYYDSNSDAIWWSERGVVGLFHDITITVSVIYYCSGPNEGKFFVKYERFGGLFLPYNWTKPMQEEKGIKSGWDFIDDLYKMEFVKD
jgi:hypothetical protein